MTGSDLSGSCTATCQKSAPKPPPQSTQYDDDDETAAAAGSEHNQLSQIPAAFLFGNIDASGNIEEDDGDDYGDDDDDNERYQGEESGARRGYLFDSATRKAFSSGGLDQILGSDRGLSNLIAVDPPLAPKSEHQEEAKSDNSEDFDESNDDIEDITGNHLKDSSLNPVIPSETLESSILECVVGFLDHLLDRIFDSNCPSSNFEPFKPQIDIEKILFEQEKIKQTAKQHNRDSIFKPLENLLPPFYSEMNMTDIFPFFVDNKPLRFFKLFSSIYHQEYFPKYHNFSVPEAITLNYYLNQKEYVDSFKSTFLSSSNKSGKEDHLARGRRDLNSNFLYRFKQHGSKNLSDWIEGPASLWYKNQNFSLSGFTVNEMESISAPSITLAQEDFELTQSYKSWRDNIIFDSNSPAALEKQENRDELERRQSMAGWVLGPNCHSYAEYCANKNQECFINEQKFENINDYLMPIRKEPHPLGSKIFSMFCHEEQNEINTIKWDDKILWNIDRKDKSMHVPLSFCLKDPRNRNNKFNRIFKSILNNAKNHSTIDLNCFISELGIKSSQDTPKAVKMPTIQTEALDKSKNSANSTQNSNQFALKHAVPVEQLHPLLFPTYLSISKLRTFHRHPLRRYSHGKMSELSKFHPVQLIKTTGDLLDRKIKDVVMKDFDALSAKDGCIVLFEYLEQYPPFLNQVGMASALINYKRIKNVNKQLNMKNWKPEDQAELQYVLRNRLVAPSTEEQQKHTNDTLFGTKTIEISNLAMPGQPPYNKVVQCFENNMFKGMTVKHSTNPNDFLLVRTREHIYLREINGVFSVGQQIPQIEVLTPCSKQAVAFNRDFFKVYVYRLFRIAKEDGYRVKMDDIKKAFPNTSENTLRKRLKHCADFKRLGCAANKNGNLVNYWILRDDFVIPDETIVSKMVSPEECCSFYSMIVAYQRLRDNGYVNKLVSLDDEDNLLDNNVRMEDELLAAPWNTTKTFLECQRGRAQYQVYGNADPTGSGEGFSFVKRVIRPPRDDTYLLNAVQAIRNCENHRKIEAAIKRLSIGEARRLLTLYDFINPDEIMELNKWNIIERIIATYREHRDYPLVVPIESLELMPENDQQSLAARKESYGFLQQRFKTDCQAVFDAQLQLLERNDEPDLSSNFYSNFSSPVEFAAASDNHTNYKVEQDYNASHQIMLMEDTKANQTNHETLEELGRNIEQMLAEDEDLIDQSNLSQDGNNNNQQIGLESSQQITSPLSNNNNNTSGNNQLVLLPKDTSKDHHLVEIDEANETQQQANNLFFKKKLRIRRSFRDDEGRVYSRIELVTNASIIELYVKSRQSPDTPQDDWEFSGKGFKDWQHNFNKNSNSSLHHGGTGTSTIRKRKKPINAAPPRKRPKSEKVLKLKCGACGQVGHMKSNKDCPYYQRTQAKMISKKNAIGVPNFQNMNYNSSIPRSPNAAMIQAGNSVMQTGLNDGLSHGQMAIQEASMYDSANPHSGAHGLYAHGDVWVKFEDNQVVFSKNIVKKQNDPQIVKKQDDAFEFESWFRSGEDAIGGPSHPDNFDSEQTNQSFSQRSLNEMNNNSQNPMYLNPGDRDTLLMPGTMLQGDTDAFSETNRLNFDKKSVSAANFNNAIALSDMDLANDQYKDTERFDFSPTRGQTSSKKFLNPYKEQLDFAKQHQLLSDNKNLLKESARKKRHVPTNNKSNNMLDKLLSIDDSNEPNTRAVPSNNSSDKTSFFPQQMNPQKFETNSSKQKNNSKVIMVTGYNPPEPIDDLMKDSSDDESNSMLQDTGNEESKADHKLFDDFFNQFFKPKQKTKSVDLDEDIVQNFVQDNIFRSSRSWLYDEVNKYLHLFTLIKTGSPKYLFNKFIIQSINHLYQMNNAEPFILPVDESFAPDYYSIIKNPLCLSDMMKKADSNEYVEFKQVDDDFGTIINNSRIYNGNQSPFTISARSLLAEYKKFLFSNRLALSYINLLNSPSESQNANYILIAYLCQILTILAQSEVGSKFIHSNNFEADIFEMYSCICKLKYRDYKSYRDDIMRLCEASVGLQSPDIRETDIKSFSVMASNLLAHYEIPLRTLFGLLESNKLPSSLSKINDSLSPPVATNTMQYISDSTSDDTVVDALTPENSLATQ